MFLIKNRQLHKTTLQIQHHGAKLFAHSRVAPEVHCVSETKIVKHLNNYALSKHRGRSMGSFPE
jgi:hypothetical protein